MRGFLFALGLAVAAGSSLDRLLGVLQVPSPPPRLPRNAPPRYMLDLYKSVTAPDGLTLSPTPHSANVVRCYADRESRHHSRFLFNISSDKTDKLLEAEFHIYKLKSRAKDLRKVKVLKSQLLQVKVYQALPPSKTKRKRRKRLLETRRISVHSTGWEIFSVKVAAAEWIADSATNLGLTLSVRGLEDESVPKGLVRFAKGNRSDKQPLLVLFMDDSRHSSGNFPGFANDYNSYQLPGKPGMELPRAKRGNGVPPALSNAGASKDGSCSRHDLYIDFERIGWSAWIISPKGYSAYQCKGTCHFPLGQNQKPTNHATIQSIAHELGLADAVHLPCCVPDRLLSISLLYFDEHENVILKQYDDMVAASCGCH
ncbi:bone morphogenetic protein 7-like [Uloborus diversus]|uniref:bone morphogenetic protein 7-like n=1 Tax=Uloborus diversus TaxID=327109 RepID=UPI0024090607|nr:bone morphogenetic protein 7-like [Uloborus diversus]